MILLVIFIIAGLAFWYFYMKQTQDAAKKWKDDETH